MFAASLLDSCKTQILRQRGLDFLLQQNEAGLTQESFPTVVQGAGIALKQKSVALKVGCYCCYWVEGAQLLLFEKQSSICAACLYRVVQLTLACLEAW